MESRSVAPSAKEAASILKAQAEVKDRVAGHAPSRSFVRFQLWGAIVISIYMGVFLGAFGGQPTDGSSGLSAFATPLLVFPIITYSLLVSGTRERFGVRARVSPGLWVAFAIVLLGFLTLGWMTVVGYDYPWWLNLLVPVLMFVAMASRPIRLLGRARALDSERWRNTPLTRPVRWTTVGIGIALGGIAAASTQPLSAIAQVVVAVLIIVCAVGVQASWGLPRAGFEWGPIHWLTFGASLGILFILAALLARTDWITTPWAVGAGIVIAVGTVEVAFLPSRWG